MRRIQKNTLEKLGHTDITEAGDGAEAIAKLSGSGPFDLVLMDWNMPNMTGIDALKKIKGDAALKAVPVIMVTSESEKTKIMEAIQAGAANYIVKPFQAEVLQEKISAVLKK
jgi:two-component system chemotaxis response regulator CheY